MFSRFRNIVLVVLPIVLGLGISSARAAATTLPGCDNPADSAFNQYCDSIPSATGPRRPQAGAPALGAALPIQTARHIAGAPGQAKRFAGRGHTATGRRHRTPDGRALLALPAAGRHRALTTSKAATPGIWSLSLWMILILAALALALIGVAIARRRMQPRETRQ